MRYRLSNHPQLLYDFAAILDLIGNYAGYPKAREKIAEIHRTLRRLKEYPHIGVLQPELGPNVRMIPSGDKAVICFVVDDANQIVHVISVTYAGQDWQRIAKNRT